jgi:hypothetical protein
MNELILDDDLQTRVQSYLPKFQNFIKIEMDFRQWNSSLNLSKMMKTPGSFCENDRSDLDGLYHCFALR